MRVFGDSSSALIFFCEARIKADTLSTPGHCKGHWQEWHVETHTHSPNISHTHANAETPRTHTNTDICTGANGNVELVNSLCYSHVWERVDKGGSHKNIYTHTHTHRCQHTPSGQGRETSRSDCSIGPQQGMRKWFHHKKLETGIEKFHVLKNDAENDVNVLLGSLVREIKILKNWCLFCTVILVQLEIQHQLVCFFLNFYLNFKKTLMYIISVPVTVEFQLSMKLI